MAKKENINNYFSHDSNARNSDKIIRLRMRHKAAGYGVYFMILERLREEPEYMSVRDYNVIAYDLREDTALIKSVVEDFGLFVFTEDGKYFYSEGFKRRMDIKDAKSKRLSEAGKRGMASRWTSGNNESEEIKKDNQVITTLYPPYNDVITTDNKVITRKEKERKEKIKEIDKEKPVSPYLEISLRECYEQLIGDRQWIEPLTMRTRSDGHPSFELKDVYDYLVSFFKKLANEGETQKAPKDAKAHFARWLSIELNKKKVVNKTAQDEMVAERKKNEAERKKRETEREMYFINPVQLAVLRELAKQGNAKASDILSGKVKLPNTEITSFLKSQGR